MNCLELDVNCRYPKQRGQLIVFMNVLLQSSEQVCKLFMGRRDEDSVGRTALADPNG